MSVEIEEAVDFLPCVRAAIFNGFSEVPGDTSKKTILLPILTKLIKENFILLSASKQIKIKLIIEVPQSNITNKKITPKCALTIS